MSPVISTGLSMPCSFCLLTHKRLVNLVQRHAPLLVSVSASIALFAIGTGPSHYAGDPFICRMRIYPACGGFIPYRKGMIPMDRSTRIAFISEHASPVALLGGADAGGQNVYVDEVSRNLARRGYAVDVFTRCDNPDVPEIIDWARGVRVVHLPAGPMQPGPKDELWPFMPEFRDSFLRFMVRDEA